MLKILTTFPIVGGLASTSLISSGCSSAVSSTLKGKDMVTQLGLRSFINGRGTLTYLSGSLMEPEVVETINYASKRFLNLQDTQDKVGERMAQLLKCEGAMVTSGAAGALTLGTAATITGDDNEKIRLLPNLSGPQREVIIQKSHRFGYDHAVRNAGVKMIEVDGPREMEKAINKNTVMMLYYNAASTHSVERDEFVGIGKKHNIPTFIDAAADVPPVENLFRFTEMGFDLVTFSGGKAIRGPQSAGLLFGRKDLIEAAKLNHSPNGNSIGRGLKVNKEEMLGMMVALDLYLNKDHDKEWEEWENRTKIIARETEKVKSVKAERLIYPGPANHFPYLIISWDENQVSISPNAVVDALRDGEPSIEISGGRDSLNISVSMMQPEEASIVASRLKQVLEQYTI